MAGRRPLTPPEERKLLKVALQLSPRDCALIITSLMTGYRISEVLSLTVSSVQRNGKLLPQIGVQPRRLKGHHGKTRYVAIGSELARALQGLLAWLEQHHDLNPNTPLFISGRRQPAPRAISRGRALQIAHAAFAHAGITNDGRLGTHSFRKTFARRLYNNSGYNLRLTQQALGHARCSMTQRYLEVDTKAVFHAILRGDFTRRRLPRAQKEVPINQAA